jgi:hypothetical protein
MALDTLTLHLHNVSNLCTGLDRPLVPQKFEIPEFLNNLHMKVLSLSALGTGRLY